MNQSMREEMNSKLEQMNEASMMNFEQIMGVLSSRKDSDDRREEMYRKQEEANEIRFRNLEDLIQKGHETILLESNRIVTEKLANLSKSSWEEMRSDCQSWILMNLTL
jgi:secreted Zn-dependent insulinase-like peptidase